MPEAVTFEARIGEGIRGGAAVEVPRAVIAALGGGGRIKVRATFDGHPYRGSVATMGGRPILGVLKDVRSAIGKDVGDAVVVTLVRDEEVRVVEVPDDLAGALSSAGARDRFDRLSYTHRKELVRWVEEARRPGTRTRRVEESVERVLERRSG